MTTLRDDAPATSAEERLVALMAAIEDPGPDTIGTVCAALEDPDAQVRRMAIEGLQEWRDTPELSASGSLRLATLRLDDLSDEVAELAVVTLRDLVDGWRDDGLPVFAEVLTSGAAPGRARAALLLRELVTEPASELLAGAVDDPAPQVRAEVATGMSAGHLAGSVRILRGLLADPSDLVRARAADAIGVLHHPTTRRDLVAAGDDPSSTVRAAVARGIGVAGYRDVDGVLVGLLADPAWEVRKEAATAIRKVGTGAAAAAVETALGDPVADVRRESLIALGVIDEATVVRHAQTLLGDTDSDVRAYTRRILDRRG